MASAATALQPLPRLPLHAAVAHLIPVPGANLWSTTPYPTPLPTLTTPPIPPPMPYQMLRAKSGIEDIDVICSMIYKSTMASATTADIIKANWCLRELISFHQLDPATHMGRNVELADRYEAATAAPRQPTNQICAEAPNQTTVLTGTASPAGSTADAATETDCPAARCYAEAVTQTHPPYTCAEVVVQTTPLPPARGKQTTTIPTTPATTTPQPKDTKGKGKATGSTAQQVQLTLPQVHPDRVALIRTPTPHTARDKGKGKAQTTPLQKKAPQKPAPTPARPAQSKTIILHSAPTYIL